MATTSCTCGFTELADESITDHLLQAFEPEGGREKDRQVHEERSLRNCACGLTASTAGELDRHFLAVFTPADAVGRDGRRHEARPP